MNVKHFSDKILIAGVDEAGRGPLAGPVYAAAVILPFDFSHPWLDDSKRLSEKKRYQLREIIEQSAVAWAVASVDNIEIDSINILNAAIKAMHKALEQLSPKPELILVDGNRFKPFGNIPYKTVIHGDATYASIAAASILAKTYRDDYMIALHNEYPQYNWRKNKGYGTREHKTAIINYGLSPYHRRRFCGFYFHGRLEMK